MIITDKAQIKAASLKESDKLHLTTSDELECYELIESDSKLPADATFTRSSVAYLSDGTQVDANMPRFEQERFGKAIMVEEGTTNYLSADIQTWGNYTLNASGYSITPVSTPYGNGVRLTGTSVERVGKATSGNIALGASYAVASVYFKPNVSNGILAIYWDTKDNTGAWRYGTFYSGQINLANYVPGQWYRLVCTADISPHTFASGGTGFKIWAEGTFDVEVAAPQLEAKPYATSFIDGTRSAETLTIPTAGVLNPQEGTVEFWVKPLVVANWNNFFYMDTSNGRFLLFFDTDGIAAFDYGPDSIGPVAPAGTIEANNWYYIALRWSATTGKQALFVNGVKYEQDLPNGVATSFPATVSIVNNYSAYIDDLRISSIARSDEEIAVAYQSGQPLAADEWTTYKLDFDDKVRITTQGQIICNELIEI